MTLDDITEMRIVHRMTNWTGANLGTAAEWHKDAHPFSEVFITAAGRHYYSRLFHTIENNGHARAAQSQDFLKRQNASCPSP